MTLAMSTVALVVGVAVVLELLHLFNEGTHLLSKHRNLFAKKKGE